LTTTISAKLRGGWSMTDPPRPGTHGGRQSGSGEPNRTATADQKLSSNRTRPATGSRQPLRHDSGVERCRRMLPSRANSSARPLLLTGLVGTRG
jgi:hypothetical protein